MAAATVAGVLVARDWPAVAIRLGEPGADGFHRSWIMLFPEGKFSHPQYGTLDFSAAKLAEIKRNYEDGAREIDIALDRDHDQGAATGWLERLEMRPALSDGASETPAGLWGLVRWTPLGVQLLQEQQYRYFSPEFKPEYTNQRTGKRYHNVLIGGALTNRPFLKVMSAVQLSDVSTRPWGQVDKACLPDSAFLDPKNRRLPVYEGAGPKDARGRYTRRGKLNINGVKAALAAVHGARTGKPMTGVPSGTVAKLERWLERYDNSGDSGESGADGGEGVSMSKKAAEPMDEEQYDEADREGDYDPDEDTHGALTTDGHTHGKYAEHSHDGDADHSDAELAEDYEEPAPKMSGKGKGSKKMSESGAPTTARESRVDAVRLAELEAELAQLREANETQARKLYEREIGEQLSEAAASFGEDAAFSKVFSEQYRAIMLSDAVREDAKLRKAIHSLVLSTAKNVVDTRALGVSFDQEARRTRKAGDGTTGGDELLEHADKIALSEHKTPLAQLSEDVRTRILLRAAQETGYKGAE